MTWTARRRALARVALATAGLTLVAVLVRGAGAGRVLAVLCQAAPRLPVLFGLELVQIASDAVALRWLLRRAPRVPGLTWLRSSAAAYAMMILFPAGRASGEVARAALLATSVGTAWAATAGAQLQASYLFANGVLSATGCVAIASWAGARSPLVVFLAVNALLMGALSAGVLAVLRGERAGRWIERLRVRFARSAHASQPLEPGARRAIPWLAAAVCCSSRAAQVVQYGVLVTAVGGASGARNAFIAHGIHLVGSTLGDVVPNQLGAVDGAYRAFAAALGFASEPARALSIAFLAHAVQLSAAAACVAIATVTGRGRVALDPGG
jgi:hypothetical protein